MSLQAGDLTKQLLRRNKGRLEWQCLCKCGNTAYIREDSLSSGKTTSCGHCNYHIKHPYAYASWGCMKQRCYNPNNQYYHRYGGRGITVCKEWGNFTNFLAEKTQQNEEST